MTKDDLRRAIPEGWEECSKDEYRAVMHDRDFLHSSGQEIYFCRKPKPEPRMLEVVGKWWCDWGNWEPVAVDSAGNIIPGAKVMAREVLP